MPIVRCDEEEAQVSRLLLIAQNGLELADTDPAAHSLAYVADQRRYKSLHLLTSFQYCWKVIQFDQRFCVQPITALFLNWHYANMFGTSTRECVKFFIRLPPWWPDYDRIGMLVVPTFMVFV